MTLTRPGTQVADLLDIQRATHVYARGLDRFDPQEAASAFTDDAVWDATAVGLERFEGRAAILGFFERDAAAIADQFHVITNHVVDLDGDTASGTNYVFSEGHTNSGAAFKAIALNEDTYRRTPEGWRIATRRISALTPPELEGFDA
ncbi:nuclear transport factor 2 family protein [Geodermatophilus aquaeductus]|jgi:ketosteroid isomerase-like protein|uniref:SnoaL-like domain-containing protein n=1 Tax=Geodermatophilus aquaeductus TaxID=1564161 RepID=A0A521FF30_9ACTN|nr:nuclear transport factor 2 family protein [Geodermatophilus aquaeductus]SMO94594.1 SnoaL-like domain-containing protein [Geodermatophilus aquaeductus]